MPTVLITAFEAYDDWVQNSSWLTLIELTRNLPEQPHVTTRRYPVDFAVVEQRLAADLAANYDFALHLGQSPGAGRIELEAVGINVAGNRGQLPDDYRPLVSGGPVAYRSELPLSRWASLIRQAGIPCQVSYHAGTYLCNAALYLSHFLADQQGLKTRSVFIHLPLEVSQTLSTNRNLAGLPVATMSAALRLILRDLASEVS
jgi:pyroglutamyl-peptidase